MNHKPNNSIIKVIYYTHVLCVKSWAMQSCWERLTQDFGRLLSVHYCMGSGLSLPTQSIAYPENSQANAARDMTSLAVKTASLQSPLAAHLYLSALRKAAMADHQDISDMNVLVEIARQVSKFHRSSLDLHQFGRDFNTTASRRALYDDHQKIHMNDIKSLPTMTFTLSGKGFKVSGTKNYDLLKSIVIKLLPDAASQLYLAGFSFRPSTAMPEGDKTSIH